MGGAGLRCGTAAVAGLLTAPWVVVPRARPPEVAVVAEGGAVADLAEARACSTAASGA